MSDPREHAKDCVYRLGFACDCSVRESVLAEPASEQDDAGAEQEYDPARHGDYFATWDNPGVTFEYVNHLRRLVGDISPWRGIVRLRAENGRWEDAYGDEVSENAHLRRRLAEVEEALRDLLDHIDRLLPSEMWPSPARERARKLLEEQDS